ncbi:lipopolysaccharide heptosyltransferase I [Chitinimonas arctica]|uniref:Lipopolysaccharide heptosyltransferase 1 n=1 Tax=Chitinimonas arctica TaxID=2594795 RepID=A0A516SF31_9NEIS|nr:lipopolysaccharide heptosyltransferase I [Chitinimonas arctica]QDQ26767.1 lipopolysaccharide heptosyltransferase I [Chitinimonas arctica]
MPKILLVRLSSMGDVIHNLPAVTDLVAHYPNAELHWAVEEGFADLPGLHPAIGKIKPFALRRWRKQPLSRQSWREFQAFRAGLKAERYDLVIDSQGLLKSALVARSSGAAIAGFDRHGAREPLASYLYDRRYAVPSTLHVIERNRLLTGQALGYRPGALLDYGIRAPACALPWRPAGDYAVLLTATSRDDKLWDEANWIGLGRHLLAQGLRPVLPWGGERERERAERIVAQLPGAVVAPRLSLAEAARLLADGRVAIGVDTGLMHLAAALGIPSIALFCASDPGMTGVLAAGFAVNLGSRGQAPGLAEVQATLARALA